MSTISLNVFHAPKILTGEWQTLFLAAAPTEFWQVDLGTDNECSLGFKAIQVVDFLRPSTAQII